MSTVYYLHMHTCTCTSATNQPTHTHTIFWQRPGTSCTARTPAKQRKLPFRTGSWSITLCYFALLRQRFCHFLQFKTTMVVSSWFVWKLIQPKAYSSSKDGGRCFRQRAVNLNERRGHNLKLNCRFVAASLCDLDFVNIVCCITRLSLSLFFCFFVFF